MKYTLKDKRDKSFELTGTIEELIKYLKFDDDDEEMKDYNDKLDACVKADYPGFELNELLKTENDGMIGYYVVGEE